MNQGDSASPGVRDDVDDGLNRGRLLMLSQPLPVLFLGDAVLADWINGAPRFHAIEFRVDSPYLFYQPVNDRARGEGPRSKNDNGRHSALLCASTRWSFAGPTTGHTPTQA